MLKKTAQASGVVICSLVLAAPFTGPAHATPGLTTSSEALTTSQPAASTASTPNPTKAPAVSAVSTRAKKKRKRLKRKHPTIKLTGTKKLKVTIAPRLTKKRQYRFTLQRKVDNSWVTVKNYKTKGSGTRSRELAVKCRTYRVQVHKTSTTYARTSSARTMVPVPGRNFETSAFMIYKPNCFDKTPAKKALVTFSPTGERSGQGRYVSLLRNIANQHNFMILGWKNYQNMSGWTENYYDQINPSSDLYFDFDNASGQIEGSLERYATAKQDIELALATYQLDSKKIVFMGFSGGGSFSHALNILYPDFAAALVVNTGTIWGRLVSNDEHANGPPFWEFMTDFRSASDYKNKSKQLIMFESETDFRFPEMQRDAPLYKSMGWNVRQVRFDGGHVSAPKALYEREFNRLVTQASFGK